MIVPGWILNKPNLIAVNIHAASLQYPGRDRIISQYMKERLPTALPYIYTNCRSDQDVDLFRVPGFQVGRFTK